MAAQDINSYFADVGPEVISSKEFPRLEDINFCKKNPSHRQFISVGQFCLAKLPDDWKYKFIYQYVSVMIKRTVILKMTFVSEKRPIIYPFYEQRGTSKITFTGSALITNLELVRKEESEIGANIYHPCPCSVRCMRERWIKATLATARHNVYDLKEVKSAIAFIGFDSAEKRQFSDFMRINLYGIDKATQISWDRISLYGAIHEEDCNQRLFEKFPDLSQVCPRNDKPLVVVVSHPHGCEKKVSIGWQTGKKQTFPEPKSKFPTIKIFYDAPTCRGSSGGPVKVFTQDYDSLFVHTGHSHGSVNQSGTQTVRISTAENEQNNNLDIFVAIKNGDVVNLETILRGTNNCLQERNPEGFTPLLLATKQDNIECVKKICHFIKEKREYIPAIDEKHTETGDTALHIALQNNYGEVVKVLLESGASQDTKNNDQKFPYQLALDAGHLECAYVCAQHKSRLEKSHEIVQNTMLKTLQTKRFDLFEKLVNSGCCFDTYNEHAIKMLENMCSCNYSTNDVDAFNTNVVFYICVDWQSNDESLEIKRKCLQLLVSKAAKIDHENKDGVTLLMKACEKGYEECVKLLLDTGANVQKVDKNGYTALILACKNGQQGCVNILLNHGVYDNTKDSFGKTGLMWASLKGYKECATLLLLHRSVDVNNVDNCGKTALMWACFKGQQEVIKLLLKHGALVDKLDQDDQTALMWACTCGHTECVKLLLEKGADVDKKDKHGNTAIFWADYHDHKECKKLLMMCSSYRGLKTARSDSCLHRHQWSIPRRKSFDF